LEFTEIILHYP